MKKPIVMCVSIHKGGSSKTTTAGNLAYSLGKMGYKVLLIDTDSQKNLSHSYGFNKSEDEYGNKNFFTILDNIWGNTREKQEVGNIRNNILSTNYENLDIVLGSRNLVRASEGLSTVMYSEQIMEDILEPLREDAYYDFIIIDTDSTLGTLNTAILQASDGAIIALTPSSFGIEGLATFISHFKFTKKKSRSPVEIFGIVFSDIDKRESMSSDVPLVVKQFVQTNEQGIKVFETHIPKDANINKAQGEHIPIGKAYPNSRSVQAYDELAREVVEHVKDR